MTIHPAVAARFPLLDGIPSMQAAMADPELDRRLREYISPDLPPAPDVVTRDLSVDGPHGPVPVRVYGDADGQDRPALLWLHGGAFMFGDLDMPEADGYSFPALADVASLAPVLLAVAEYDDLRTSAETFADQLAAAGVDVRLVLADGMLHGFLNLAADLEPVEHVLTQMAASVASPTTVPAS